MCRCFIIFKSALLADIFKNSTQKQELGDSVASPFQYRNSFGVRDTPLDFRGGGEKACQGFCVGVGVWRWVFFFFFFFFLGVKFWFLLLLLFYKFTVYLCTDLGGSRFCFVLFVLFYVHQVSLFFFFHIVSHSFLSRLNCVQKETMWSLILYVVCM